MFSKYPWIRAYAGGLLGTAVFVWLVYAAPLRQLDFASALVKVVFGFLPASSSDLWYAGYYHMFLLGSMFLPWVYSRGLYKALTHSPVLNGLTLGIMLWALRELIMVPAAGLEGLYSGFSTGTQMVFASLLAHVSYGLCLCVVAGRYCALPQPRMQTARSN